MERRLRARAAPSKDTKAFLTGFCAPVDVVDYCACGMALAMNGDSRHMTHGMNVGVDIMVDGALRACGLCGTVCWAGDGRVGLRLDCRNDMQMKAAHDLEVSILRG